MAASVAQARASVNAQSAYRLRRPRCTRNTCTRPYVACARRLVTSARRRIGLLRASRRGFAGFAALAAAVERSEEAPRGESQILLAHALQPRVPGGRVMPFRS